jgi:hypothetical protein
MFRPGNRLQISAFGSSGIGALADVAVTSVA